MSPTKNSRYLSRSASNQLIYCFPENKSKMSTLDQVVLLMQNIEDFLVNKNKAGAVFVNLTAAYGIAMAYKYGFNC